MEIRELMDKETDEEAQERVHIVQTLTDLVEEVHLVVCYTTTDPCNPTLRSTPQHSDPVQINRLIFVNTATNNFQSYLF